MNNNNNNGSKARLIKKQEAAQQPVRKAIQKQKVVKKTVDSVVEWLDQRAQKQDPRKAFAALFVTPQTQQ